MGKNFIEKGESTPQVPSFPLLPPRQPTNNLLSQRNPSKGRASFRLPTYDFKLVHVFCSRLSHPEKLHKKNLKTLPKKTKSPYQKEKKKNQQNQPKPFPPGPSPVNPSQTSQDAEPVVFFFDQLSLCDLPIPNPTDSHITRSTFDLPGLLCLKSSSPSGQPRSLVVARSHPVKSLLRCVHPESSNKQTGHFAFSFSSTIQIPSYINSKKNRGGHTTCLIADHY